MRIELESEAQEEQPVIVFNLRRHLQGGQPTNAQKIYLTAKYKGVDDIVYPIAINGQDNTIRIRKRALEKLGFAVVVEDFG